MTAPDWHADWRPVVEAVGTDFARRPAVAGADVIEQGGIRRYLEPLEFDCPLHYDKDVARSVGYEDIVAPYTAAISFTLPAIWSAGDLPTFTGAGRDAQPERAPLRGLQLPMAPSTTGYFVTDVDMHFHRPAMLGERLSRQGRRLTSCTPKEISVGKGAFVTMESDIVTQGGAIVATFSITSFSYVPHRSEPPRVPTGQAEGSVARAAERQVAAAEPSAARSDWAQQRYWEDVSEGDTLPVRVFPLSVYRLVVAAGGNRDFNSIHHNGDYARRTGAPDMYANTMMLQGMWERSVREYIGLRGTVRSMLGFRMGSFNVVGDAVSVHGKVLRVWKDGDLGLVQLGMWSENASGRSVGPGTVEVVLPQRAGSPPAPDHPGEHA